MAKKEEFEHESIQDNRSISNYLQALIDGFESGKITFNSEGQQINLYPNDMLELSIRAKKKGGKNKIAIRLFWKDSNGEAPSGSEFRISTT
ncbi:amphi-Trp domain-containing protein [Desulfonema ishimotonii]|uniref:Amphi-Trp domain-containing protein n=1 Tax=Desulfonema ishimotonii TaxID=45657 RepID=A0A401FRP9_9BACT|nr:amphi-Trp domain-containing protein [Desulfonema ishimotonii]GBC59630.1 amphi-Trp domain-containing protein [Desulfonema ishimotonii]